MTKPVLVHPAARAEYLAAISWYEDRRPGLGEEFAEAVDGAMEGLQPLAQHAPDPATRRGPRVHRAIVRRFPYRIVAVDLPEVVLVVAFAHTSRRPGYWRARLHEPS